MSFEILDPTYDDTVETLIMAPRLGSTEGCTVGIVSNGKKGTAPFFDELERVLRDDYGVADVVRAVKADYSAPADAATINSAQTWHALIAGIGD